MKLIEQQLPTMMDRPLWPSLALAVLVHGALLSASYRWTDYSTKLQPDTVLSLTLLKEFVEVTDDNDRVLEEPIAQAITDKIEGRSTVPIQTQEEFLTSETVTIQQPLVQLPSPQQLRDFTAIIEGERTVQENKIDLSKPRKGSYAKVYQEKRTTERKNDPIADVLVASPDGVIRQSRVNGRVFCTISIARGADFNGLVPYRTGVSGFSCDSPDNSNVLLSENGQIANSDREEWPE